MKAYLNDPVLNLTAGSLRLLRWLFLGLTWVSIFAVVLTLLALLISGGTVLDTVQRSEEVFALLLGGVAFFYLIARFLRALRDVVLSVGEGQPLTMVNAARIRSMAWLALTIAAFVFAGSFGYAIYKGFQPLVSIDDAVGLFESALMAAVLFILARVFELGARMQEELEGTV